TTTEIDDAFSVQPLPGGNTRFGIHIAAPALGVVAGSPLDAAARARLSTVYFPGDKITMLPPTVIDAYTLTEGGARPALGAARALTSTPVLLAAAAALLVWAGPAKALRLTSRGLVAVNLARRVLGAVAPKGTRRDG
ncbi:MAG: RNB domain-containing ribonuclease, partial [Gammaproteobacteria bacterium]|nr:RNB domain-containing ribonuclease [Gammaproteobacteria bacterium]